MALLLLREKELSFEAVNATLKGGLAQKPYNFSV